VGIPSLSLEGRVAIVTGGKRGMGRAIALTFAEAGADVAVCSRVVAGGELDAVAEEIRKLGRRSLAVQADVGRKVDVDNLVQKVVSELGDIDILVNNAGVFKASPLVDLPEEDWDEMLDTNLRGCYLCCQAVAKGMIKRKTGSIINIASAAAFNPAPSQSAYNCSKTAVRMLTSILAFELARYNILVNAIAPGWTRTKMTEFLEFSPSDKAAALANIALGRMGEPQEIANVALFLASDLASYATGATWRVDGGVNPMSLSVAPEKI